jgi:hypothetical protein
LLTYKILGKLESIPKRTTGYEWILYNRPLSLLVKYNIRIIDFAYEFDPHGKLHYHGIIELPKGFYRKKLVVRGYHMNLTKLQSQDSIRRATSYIHKDDKVNHMYREHEQACISDDNNELTEKDTLQLVENQLFRDEKTFDPIQEDSDIII